MTLLKIVELPARVFDCFRVPPAAFQQKRQMIRKTIQLRLCIIEKQS